jgi:uncharacterized protein with HEPN domain
MRPDGQDAAHLWDMLDAAREARAIVEGIPVDRFLGDSLRRRALERTIELVGEAARRVTPEFQATCPEIDWRGLIGQRNILTHEYGRINHRLLYEAASERLPELIGVLERIIGALPQR